MYEAMMHMMTQTISHRSPARRFGLRWVTQLCMLIGLIALPLSAVQADTSTTSTDDAQSHAQFDALWDALKFEAMVDVIVIEGEDLAREMSTDMPAPAAREWDAFVSAIYTDAHFRDALYHNLYDALMRRDADLPSMVAFYTTDLGERLAQNDLDTRRAFLDDAVFDLAVEAWGAIDPELERVTQINAFVEITDTIERNVTAVMNSEIAYWNGMAQSFAEIDADIPPFDQTEILREIWSREPDIRAFQSEWIYAFLSTTFAMLSSQDIETFLTFSDSAAGRQLNAAMYEAFNVVYDDMSRVMGAQIGQISAMDTGEEL